MTAINITSKVCARCKEEKPVSEFHRTPLKYNKSGYVSYCKPCQKVYSDAYRNSPQGREKRRESTKRYKANNKTKIWLANKAYVKTDGFRRRNNERKKRRKYGITVGQYNEMVAAQHGVCAICGKPPKDGGRRLSIDHCHETNVIRGLLCDAHNIGLGMFHDSITELQSAIDYLQRSHHELKSSRTRSVPPVAARLKPESGSLKVSVVPS